MEKETKPTIGLALSGGGNRSSFYIGFLEVLSEKNIKLNYITACSGGCLAALAFACGTLPEFKEKVFGLDRETLKTYFARNKGKGGFFSIDLLEEEIRNFTKGLTFEEVRPLMGFVAVDIENGEKVLLCMGDIARAARISCTIPGVFDPVKWGGKTLVDGGLLTMVPGDFLRQANMDITIGVHMRGTKHIFLDSQITAKKIYNFIKRVLFIEELESLFDGLFKMEDEDFERQPNFFQVVGKSMDLAIKANQKNNEAEEVCDLVIYPNLPRLKQSDFTQESVKYYYEMGRKVAEEYVPKINELIEKKKLGNYEIG
jgi:NTE family protein